MATALSVVALCIMVLIAVTAKMSVSSKAKVRDDLNAIVLTTKDARYVTTERESGHELFASSNADIETQLHRKTKSKKEKSKRNPKAKKVNSSKKKGKRAYKITYPKYAVIEPNEVTYTSSATDRKGQVVVEDWRQG
jgi:hypothetical protein